MLPVLRDLTIPEALRPQLHIAGTFLTYGNGAEGEIVEGMQELYPGLRRLLGDDEATYTFRKYGVPYFINLACSNGPPQPEALTCTQADAVVRIVLRDLPDRGWAARNQVSHRAQCVSANRNQSGLPVFSSRQPPGGHQ